MITIYQKITIKKIFYIQGGIWGLTPLISWLSVLLVKETRENNDLPQVTDKLLSKGWKAKKLRSLWNQEIQKT